MGCGTTPCTTKTSSSIDKMSMSLLACGRGVQEARFEPTHHQRWRSILILRCVAVRCEECRRQDSNLRTVTDWDLIPAPLTKLGDSCADLRSVLAYINTATFHQACSSKKTATSSSDFR